MGRARDEWAVGRRAGHQTQARARAGGLDPLGDEDLGRAALLDDRLRGPVADDEARREVERLFDLGPDVGVGLGQDDEQGAPTLVT